MRKSFYFLAFLSACAPAALLGFGGLYFFHKQRVFNEAERVKIRLKEESLSAAQKWERALNDLAREAREIAQKKGFPPISSFHALAVRRKGQAGTAGQASSAGEYQLLIPSLNSPWPPGRQDSGASSDGAAAGSGKGGLAANAPPAPSPPLEGEAAQPSGEGFSWEGSAKALRYQKLLALLDDKRKAVGGFFSAASARRMRLEAVGLEGQAAEPALLLPPSELSPEIAAFISLSRLKAWQEGVWNFSSKEVRERLLFNSQGWLFFHPKGKSFARGFFKRALPKLSSSEKKAPRLVQWEREGKKAAAFLRPVHGTNLWTAAQAAAPAPPLRLSAFEWRWLALALSALAFALSALFLIISPLSQAYGRLKQALLVYGSKGALPLILSSNRLLRFYDDVYESAQRRAPQGAASSMEPSGKTFQQALQEEEGRLKEKYPGFSLEKDLKSNVSLFQFAPFMKKMLSALLLNGIEAMGASPRQTLKVSSFEEGKFFVFSVEDRGRPITSLQAKEAFTLYHSTKSQLGVGLNLVSAIVSANGGSVHLAPVLGKEGGTQAEVRLPLSCFLKSQSFEGFSLSLQKRSKDPAEALLHYFNQEKSRKSEEPMPARPLEGFAEPPPPSAARQR